MAPSATRPTSELGYASETDGSFWSTQETTPELRWPLSTRVYDQMRRQDSQVTAVMRAVTLPVRRTPWRLDPNGARPEVVAMISQDLGLPVIGGEDPLAKRVRSRGRFSWAEHLRLALLSMQFGHMFFEQVYRLDEDGRYRLHKLSPRMPQTISDIKVARDGGLISIEQYGVDSTGNAVEIPVERLVAYTHERDAGDWVGSSILRPAYKNWLIKDRLLRVQTQTIERNGMGVPVYQAGSRDEQAQLDAGKKIATSYKAGAASGAALPWEAKLRLLGVEGNLPDAQPAITYHDNAMAKAVLAHFLNLDGKGGSYALASTQEDFFTLSLQTEAQYIADVANQHVVEDLVDANFGEDEPAPRIVFDEIGSRQDATASALKTLVDAGLLEADAPVRSAVRQGLGFPDAEPEQTTKDLTAAEAKARADAAAVLIRSGFDPQGALEAVGLDPITHLGLLPVTVQKPVEPVGEVDEELSEQLAEPTTEGESA